MQASSMSGLKPTHQTDVSQPMMGALVPKSVQAYRHKKEMLRYLVLISALLAVILLIAIALYYTQGKSVTIEHISALSPSVIFRA